MFNASEFVKTMSLTMIRSKLAIQISILDGFLADGVIDEVEHAKQVSKANADFVSSFDFAVAPVKKENPNEPA